MNTFSVKQLLLLGLIIVFISCEEDEPLFPDVSETFGIRHDKELVEYEAVATNQSPYDSEEYPDFASVVAFSYSLDGSDNAEFVATGTLISPEWILTAGHNFFVAEEQEAPAPVSGISVLVGDDPNEPSDTYEVAELIFHPTWIAQSNDFLNGNDLCLVKLTTPITGISTAQMNLSGNETIGNTVWGCGYGDYSRQPGQDPDAFSKKHAIQNTLDRSIDGVMSSVNGETYTGGLLAFDFDDPDGVINALGDETVNEDEALLGDGTSGAISTAFEATTVQGDSGGPLFIRTGGAWKIAGVLSGGASNVFEGHADSSYGDISIYISVASHRDWIESVIQ